MLWGWFISVAGSAIFFVTPQVPPSMAVAVPGFDFGAVNSNWVSTQISPSAGVVGLNNLFAGTVRSTVPIPSTAERSGTSILFPCTSYTITGTAGKAGVQEVLV